MTFTDLPIELIYEISDYLHAKHDLNTFVRTSSTIYRLFNYRLYRLDRKDYGSSALLWSAIYDKPSTMIHSLKERAGGTNNDCSLQEALLLAVQHGHCAATALLLENGAKINAQGGKFGNALQTASCSITSNARMMKLLLEKGANVNEQGGYYGSALQATAWAGNEQTIKLLLDYKANVHASGGYFGNALQGASYAGKIQIVKMLISQNADVNAQGGFYGNALQAASWKGHMRIVKILIRAGARVDAPGGYYDSALQAALNGGHKRVAGLLQYWLWRNQWAACISGYNVFQVPR